MSAETQNTTPNALPSRNRLDAFHKLAHVARQAIEKDAEIARLQHEVNHDPATGMLRREAWRKNVQEGIEQGKRFGIFYLDLNGFKKINDILGHDKADAIVADLGVFLPTKFRREEDTIGASNEATDTSFLPTAAVGRMGGDEFAIKVDLEPSQRDNDSFARRLGDDEGTFDSYAQMDAQYMYLESAAQEFIARQSSEVRKLGFGIAIGAAVFDPEIPTDLLTLEQQADESMREHKAHYGSGR